MSAKKTTEQFILDAKAKHGDKYDYRKVNYVDAHKKVIIICPLHGEFEQKAYSHLQSKGCDKCGIEKITQSRRSNTQEFIEKANKIHNNKYDYSLVEYGKNNRTKVTIICPFHGDFEQIPNTHLSGGGCLDCCDKKKKNTQIFIQKAKAKHGDKYDYRKVNYVDAHKKVIIICPLHGEFEQKPSSHYYSNGCDKCGRETVSLNLRSTPEQFIEQANKIHNNKYDYSLVEYGKNNRTKVTIICPIHGDFEQAPDPHLRGSGCLKCNESKGEKAVENFLTQFGKSFEREYKFKFCKNERCLPFDFYLPEDNLCIEYQGEQHYYAVKWSNKMSDEDCKKLFEKTTKRDQIKVKYCKEKGISLLTISYKHFDNIEDIIKTYFTDITALTKYSGVKIYTTQSVQKL
jgi:hypothetical protein